MRVLYWDEGAVPDSHFRTWIQIPGSHSGMRVEVPGSHSRTRMSQQDVGQVPGAHSGLCAWLQHWNVAAVPGSHPSRRVPRLSPLSFPAALEPFPHSLFTPGNRILGAGRITGSPSTMRGMAGSWGHSQPSVWSGPSQHGSCPKASPIVPLFGHRGWKIPNPQGGEKFWKMGSWAQRHAQPSVRRVLSPPVPGSPVSLV